MADLRIENVEVWNASGIQSNCDVLVKNEKVWKIAPHGEVTEPSGQTIDGQGRSLVPLGVDAQVHLRVPGQTEKETAATGLLAAKTAGVGAVLTMPNTHPVIDNPTTVKLTQETLKQVTEKLGPKAFISAAITMGQKGESLVDFNSLAKAGVKAFTDDGRGVASDELMAQAFELAAEVDLPCLQHAEIPGHGGVLAPGPTQEKLGIPSYSPEPEWKMVQRDLEVLRRVPAAKYHVLHISSWKTLELIEKARQEGLKVTGEVTPHHLWFTSDDIPETDCSFKMNPPLRSEEDREALRSALSNGLLSFLSTDHAPHEPDAKKLPFETAAFGTTCLEASFRTLLALHNEGYFSKERLVEVFSTAPAQFLGIDDEFGTIAEGKPFNAALIDTEMSFNPIEESDLTGQSKNSCFLGAKLPGKILAVSFGKQMEWI